MQRTGTESGATAQWRGRTQGNGPMHRLLIWLLGRWPLWMFYFFAAVVMVPGYMLLTPRARRALRHYYRRAGIRRTPWALYRSYYSFSQAIIDRFAAYAGRSFDIEMIDNHIYRELEQGSGGFIMLGSHVGNYELTGYLLKLRYKPLNALLYGGEAEAVMNGRHRLFAGNNINIVTVVPGSLEHVFAINDALGRGEIVSVPADRTFGSTRTVSTLFLGGQAPLPLGPFMLAASHDVPAVAVFMVKSGYRSYRVIVRRVSLDASEYELPVRLRAEALCRRYADVLQQIVRDYPYQWFNFFDFWGDDRCD